MTVISFIAATLLALSLSNVFPWIQGRMNVNFYGLLLNVAGLAAWLFLAMWLLWRAAIAPLKGKTDTVLKRFGLIVVTFLPWMILAFQQSSETVYSQGFRKWVTNNVDVLAIRQWQRNLDEVGAVTAPAPFWWPTRELEAPLGVPVSSDLMPASISALGANEVRTLPDTGALLLAWKGDRTAWVRFVVIGKAVATAPVEFRAEHVRWQNVGTEMLIGIVERH